MTILVTGTSGKLGRLIVEALLDRGTAPAEIIAVARNLDAIADLSARGVITRTADYDDPVSLEAVFVGVDKAVLVSSNAIGSREKQHRNVIDAAKHADVSLLAYTSIAGADTSTMTLAAEHLATEWLLGDSGLPTVVLRNGWYIENYTENAAPALATGTVIGSAGSGRVSAATRRDYAEAAAAVLTTSVADQAGKVYELGGEPGFTLSEYADVLAHVTGKDIGYQNLSTAEHAAALVEAGLPQDFAEILADSDRGIAVGDLSVDSGDLARLIGRPSTPLVDAVRSALGA